MSSESLINPALPSGDGGIWSRRAAPPSFPGFQPSALVQRLKEELGGDRSPDSRSRLPRAFFQKLDSLAKEKDSEIFYFGLLYLGRELKKDLKDEAALALLQFLIREEAVTPELKAEALQESEAILGKGSFGRRVEYHASRFVRDSLNYKMIVPMFLGTATFSFVRTLAMGRLASTVAPLGSRTLLANLAGFGAELSSFSLSSRLFYQMAGEPVRESLSEDLLSAGITLGALKVAGWVGSNVPFSSFQPTSTFLGLYSAHKLEEAVGLRQNVDEATTVTDTLAAMVSLGVGAHLGQMVFGSKYAAFQQEMDLRTANVNFPGMSLGLARAEASLGVNGPYNRFSRFSSHISLSKKMGDEPARSRLIPIQIDFEISKNPSEEEIGKIVQAIVAQDHERYPDGNASVMSGSPKYFKDARYDGGGYEFTLATLAGWVRRARRFKAGDTKALSNSQILKKWKKAVFEIEEKEVNRNIIPIRLDFPISDSPTEEEIGRIIQAIVTQDSELYHQGDASVMSTSAKYFRDRWYRSEGHEFTLQTLTYWVRLAKGLKTIEKKALPNSQILKEWKKDIFGIDPELKGIPLQLDFSISDLPKEEEIGRIVQAIVAQDPELYPKGDASVMSTSVKYFSDRRYQSGRRSFTLETLAGWVRRSRGLKTNDLKSLPPGQILMEWKWELFGIDRKLRGRLLALDFPISDSPTEEEIRRIIQAIVAQDYEIYPKGDVSVMSGSPKFFKNPRYHIGSYEFTLDTLAGWIRRARGLKAGDTKVLPNSQILRRWKGDLSRTETLPIKKKEVERSLISLHLDFPISNSPKEEEIWRIVRAIVAQDHEIYYEGDASTMSIGPKYLKNRWYQSGGRAFTLGTLAGWVRRARGLKADDTKALPNRQILKEWKKAVFEIDEKKVERNRIPIRLDFPISDSPTEEEIGRIIQAIAAQDPELYPEGDASNMSGSPKYFSARRYQGGGKEFTLDALAGWVRLVRGLKTKNTKELPNSQILKEWKKDFFGIDPELKGKSLHLNFFISNSPTEEEIGKILQAIVAQDPELYPKGDASAMNSGSRYFRDRRYQSDGQEFTLQTLAGWVRSARGLKAGDTKALPHGQILKEWKEKVFGINKKRAVQSLIPLRLDFPLSDSPTVEEIGKIVQAIVDQDPELYPGGDSSAMSTSPKYWHRGYQMGRQKFTLQTLASWVRRARGLKAVERQNLPDSQIVKEWRERLLNFMGFHQFSSGEIEAFLQTHSREELLHLFSEVPWILTEVLTFLKENKFKNKDQMKTILNDLRPKY